MALREILASFGFDVDDSKLKGADKRVDGFISKMQGVGTAIAGAFALGTAVNFTRELVNMGDEIGDVADQLGTSGGELQRWRFIAESGGASTGALTMALKTLSRQAVDAQQGGGEMAATFKKLGVSTKDAAGRMKTPTQLFEETGLAVASLADPAERIAVSMKLFGKSGAEIAPVFAKGAKGVKELSKRFDELGGGLDDNALKALGEADQKFRENEIAVRGLKGALANALLPALNGLVVQGTNAIAKISDLTKGTHAAEVATAGLGIAAGGAALKWLAPMAPLAAATGTAVLVWDDLLAMLNGAPSAFGELFAAIDGGEKSADVLSLVAKGWRELTADIDKAKTAADKARVVLDFGKGVVADVNLASGNEGINERLNNLRNNKTETGGTIESLDNHMATTLSIALEKKRLLEDNQSMGDVAKRARDSALAPLSAATGAGASTSALAALGASSPFAGMLSAPAVAAVAKPQEVKVDAKNNVTIQQTVTVQSVEDADALASTTRDGVVRGLNEGNTALRNAVVPAVAGR